MTDQTCPLLRGVIREGALLVAPWHPGLARAVAGAERAEFETRETSIVDLIVFESDGQGREVIARFLFEPPASQQRQAQSVLRDWAEAAGYDRLWLRDRLMSLNSRTAPNVVSIACRSCGAESRSESPDFWSAVYRFGRFPDTCSVCGATMPQWVQQEREPAPSLEPTHSQAKPMDRVAVSHSSREEPSSL